MAVNTEGWDAYGMEMRNAHPYLAPMARVLASCQTAYLLYSFRVFLSGLLFVCCKYRVQLCFWGKENELRIHTKEMKLMGP